MRKELLHERESGQGGGYDVNEGEHGRRGRQRVGGESQRKDEQRNCQPERFLR